jgi:hypothetical protein
LDGLESRKEYRDGIVALVTAIKDGAMSGIFGSGLGLGILYPPVKRKVFVSYQHSGDQPYYEAFSKAFHDSYEVISDNSLERSFDSDDATYVMRRIREKHISGSSCTIVLVGPHTWGRKYVDWEIDATLEKQHGLIGIQLPSVPINPNNTVNIPERLHQNIQSGYAIWASWGQITLHPPNLSTFIEMANAKPKNLINNLAPLRQRNTS